MSRVYDELTGLEMQIKRAGESTPFDFIFQNLLQGETISAINSVVVINRGIITSSANIVEGLQSHNSINIAQVWFSGGTTGEFYCLSVLVTTSIGAIRSCSGVIQVNDPC